MSPVGDNEREKLVEQADVVGYDIVGRKAGWWDREGWACWEVGGGRGRPAAPASLFTNKKDKKKTIEFKM